MVYRGRSPIILWDCQTTYQIFEYWIDSLDPWMSLSESRHGWAFPRLLIHLPQISTSFVLKPSHLWSHWEQYAGRLDHYAFGILICEVSCPAVVVVGFQGREQTASSVWTWSFGVSGFGIGLRRSVWSISMDRKTCFYSVFFAGYFFSQPCYVEDWIQLNLPAPIREMSSAEKGPSCRSRKFCGSLDLLQNLTGHGKALPANADA